MALKNSIGNIPAKLAASVLLASSIFYSSIGLAQDAQTQAPATQTPATDGTQPAAAAGSQQQAAPAQQPQQARVLQYDDWYYRCVDIKGADGSVTTSCEVAQIVNVKQGDQNVSVLTLAFAQVPGSSDLMLTALVPLNIFLPAGLGIGVDNKPVIAMTYRNCNQAGCWSQQKLDGKMIDALQKGTNGQGALQLMNGQKVSVQFSLKGLGNALAEMQKSAPAAAKPVADAQPAAKPPVTEAQAPAKKPPAAKPKPKPTTTLKTTLPAATPQ
ncbi:MAG: invasion associated locus B family protein [Rhizobiaceae bacterium]|nr:invasion associated locus B family protein [Rhizobiaceae bacterium]